MRAELFLLTLFEAYAKPTVPISVIIPCNVEDFHFLPLVLASIANQTALPEETVLVANLPQPYANGVLLIDTGKQSRKRESLADANMAEWSDSADHENLFTWLFDNIAGAAASNLSSITIDSDNSSIEGTSSHNSTTTGRNSPNGPSLRLTKPLLDLPDIAGFAANFAASSTPSSTPSSALESLLAHLPDAKMSISSLPRLKVYVRAGTHYAGANRVYGGLHASSEIVSFFDADDYMHPQRMERLWAMFNANRDLEALIHSYTSFKITDWPKKFGGLINTVYDNGSTRFILNYQDFWNALPKHKLQPNQSEPIYDNASSYSWWFPKDMDLQKWPSHVTRQGHNGWLTIKKKILADVQYPDIRRGQDSLYNWRLLSAHRKWNFLPEALGAYISFR